MLGKHMLVLVRVSYPAFQSALAPLQECLLICQILLDCCLPVDFLPKILIDELNILE